MTVAWDGRGLPPAARARLERAAKDHAPASLFGISGQAALEACGFSVVGEVMGCIVEFIGWSGYGGCGYMRYQPGYGRPVGLNYYSGGGGYQSTPRTVLSSESSAWKGFAPYVRALYDGYDTALLRMLLETRDLGGDGVIGVNMKVTHLGEGMREFMALGTAVRAHSSRRPKSLFSTPLPAHDVAKLLHGGWVPAAYSIGISVGNRHNDWRTSGQSSAWAGNVEVSGYTELVNEVRKDARRQFAKRVSAMGAEGAIMSWSSLQIGEAECEGGGDHIATAVVAGTAIARFHKTAKARTDSLKILNLRDKTGQMR